MSELISTGRILTDRDLDDNDLVVKKLAEDISRNGQQVPILVLPTDSGYYELVDGLRRLDVMMKAGHTQIQAVVARELSEAISNLEMAHPVPPDRVRRVWEIRQALNGLIETRNAILRRRRRPVDGRRVVEKAERIRHQLARAFGGMKSVDKILFIYRAAKSGDPVAIEKLQVMEERSLRSPNTDNIARRVNRPRFDGEVTQPRKQLDLLEATTRSLQVNLIALQKLGPIRMESQDLKRITADLWTARTTLTGIIRLLEEAAK